MKLSAIEQAAKAVLGTVEGDELIGASIFPERSALKLADTAIFAFLKTLLEDDVEVEAIAKFVCEAQGFRWEDQFTIRSTNGDEEAHESFRQDVRDTIRALISRMPS